MNIYTITVHDNSKYGFAFTTSFQHLLSPSMSVLTSFFMFPVAPVPRNNFSVTISSKWIVEHTHSI